MIVEKKLKSPPDIKANQQKDSDRVARLLKTKKLKLGGTKISDIEQDLFRKCESWKKATTKLKRNLVKYNDLLEGVVEQTNFPFEGSSNITTHYAAGITRTFEANFNKTMYQDDEVFIPVLDPTLNMDKASYMALQEGFNYLFSKKYNGLDTLKEGTVPTVRDGTTIISAVWEREVEQGTDQRTYRDSAEFLKDYPNAEEAGMAHDEFQSLLDQFILEPDSEVIVNFEYDFVQFEGIKFKINSFAKFIFYPLFSKSIRTMELYGNEYQISDQELKLGLKKKLYYDDGVEKVMKFKQELNVDEWDRARTQIDGINLSGEDSKPIRLCDLVYKYDLDGDGIPEKYLVTYALDAKALLSIQDYTIRRNIDICVEFKMVERENRFPGVSLIGDCEDLFTQIDVLHRHRNNVRMLTTSPIFLAQKGYKDLIDLGRAENVIRPGLTLWVDDVEKSIRQLPIQDLSTNADNMDEEMSLKSYVELTFGPTQGMSGQQTSNDPRAPAHKTAMLMMASNTRMDAYMEQFRKSLPRLAELVSALVYQYSNESEIAFDSKNKALKFPVALLADSRITWQPKRRSVSLTPEFAMSRLQGLIAQYAQMLPLIMQGDQIATEIWNRSVLASGEPESDKLLIDDQKAQEAQQKMQQMQQMQQQQQQMALQTQVQQRGKEALATEVGKRQGKNMIPDLEKLASLGAQ